MPAWRRGWAIGLVTVLLIGTLNPVLGQSDAELDALLKQAQRLQLEGKFAEALAVQRGAVSLAEKMETISNGKPGAMTGIFFSNLSWHALHARRFDEALAAAERARTFAPAALWIETNRAHALLFLGRTDEARALYLAHARKRASPDSAKIWDEVIADDFESLRKAGLVHVAFAEIVAALKRDAELDELRNEAFALNKAGKSAEAVPLAERYVEAMKAHHGPESPQYAFGLSSQAIFLMAVKRLAEAEGLARRALTIDEGAVGPEHPNVARDLIILGEVLRATNRLAEAETLIRRALAVDEKSYGPEHPDVGRDLNKLALLLKDTNRLGEAEPLFRRALALLEKKPGPEDLDVAVTLFNLAGLLKVTNQVSGAEPLYRRAIAIIEKTFGPEHPHVALVLNDLAHMLTSHDRLAAAEPLMRRALAINEKTLGPEHPSVATSLNNLAQLMQTTNRLTEAEPMMRLVLAIDEKSLGPQHSDVARDLNNLAQLLAKTNRLAEAEPLHRRAYAISEKSLGAEHPMVATSLGNLALLLKDTNRPAEAEPLMRRALPIDEKSYGPEHPNVAMRLNNLAALLQDTNRIDEAEPLFRRALAIHEKSYGPEHPKVAASLGNLAYVLEHTNRTAHAEPLLRRALAIEEKSYGPEHPDVALRLNNLGALLQRTNRLAEAAPLMRRALAIEVKSYGPEHPNVARDLNNLAELLRQTGRSTEAEPLYRRALAIDEKSVGPDHPNVAARLGNLAELLKETGRRAAAEELMRRALAIDEKSYGPEHPSVAVRLNNLAMLLSVTNRLGEAEPLLRRALAIDEKRFALDHPTIATDLNNLALIRAELGDWGEAARLHARAKQAMTATRNREEGDDRTGIVKAVLTRNAGGLRAMARAVFWAAPLSMHAREEGFELAQWALQTAAADALSQMSVRFAKGAGPLAQVVGDRQNLLVRRQSEDRLLFAAFGKADPKEAEAARAAIADLDTKLDAIDQRLAKEFPDYVRLANPKPLTIAAAQALLRPNEALIVFLDVPQLGNLPGETLAWAVTRTEVRWISIPLSTASLRERVATLRCGLDRDGLWSRDGQRLMATGEHCRKLRPEGVGADEPLPFDLGFARELYWALLAPFDDLIKGKSVIIVPSGPLRSLPFHVLVTRPPVLAGGRPDYRKAAWLALQQPVTVLPSVGSLRALRELTPSQAKEPYLAFGNPLLDGGSGDKERAQEARAKQTCPQEPENMRAPLAATTPKTMPSLGTLFRGGAVDVAALRRQTPLPETADELCAVAKAMGALGRQASTVWLGARATESNLKALSREGKLATYKVLHFATHGLLAAESAAILKDSAEPALMLSPPRDGSSDDELAHDDGLLTASEVAQLNLDADWVVLSACNTAAGEKGDAEALSGLARAFFYAKARALLVSHWYVDSNAAVNLTTRTFAELRADRRIGRAEALRRSMAKMIAGGTEAEAHPATWAPFVLVGEGAR